MGTAGGMASLDGSVTSVLPEKFGPLESSACDAAVELLQPSQRLSRRSAGMLPAGAESEGVHYSQRKDKERAVQQYRADNRSSVLRSGQDKLPPDPIDDHVLSSDRPAKLAEGPPTGDRCHINYPSAHVVRSPFASTANQRCV